MAHSRQDATVISGPVGETEVPGPSEVVEGVVEGWYWQLGHVCWVVGELISAAA